jgi:hypothetical protein
MPLLDDFISKCGLLNADTYMVHFARTLLNACIGPSVCATLRQDPHYVWNDLLSRLLATHTKDLEFITNDRV